MFKIDWMENYGNSPVILVYIDELPEVEYEYLGGRMWAGEKDGFVSYFSHDGSDNNNGGYGGAVFERKLIDGTTRTFVGPWSSRVGVVNHYKGYPYAIDVTFVDSTGYRTTGALTLDFMRQHWDLPYYIVGTNGPLQDNYPPTVSDSENSITKPSGQVVLTNCERLI